MTSRPTPSPTRRPTPRFDAIGIVTADLAASVAFYRRLGLDFPDGAEKQPHVEAELGGGVRLLLDTEETVRSFHPGWRPPSGGGRIALAMLCGSAAEVDSLHEELVGAGYRSELKPWDAVWGQRYACVLDPDGNGVDLFAPLPPAAPSTAPAAE
ncbi:VOC family protein [Streptomyces sp. WI04-05B]|uniref:VOC family protein n=1 Tax=Streptomyces TaxID=1883 RepID=UPI0029B63364|nr:MULTISPECIES: VOC family protein [unclassified Streptomyces]MDX2546683.1 VOC family protein [Streptomyces sp. WI04-05B]MDX2587686.1 VOC family protein [Streptomyces sp. WI04-05A]